MLNFKLSNILYILSVPLQYAIPNVGSISVLCCIKPSYYINSKLINKPINKELIGYKLYTFIMFIDLDKR